MASIFAPFDLSFKQNFPPGAVYVLFLVSDEKCCPFEFQMA